MPMSQDSSFDEYFNAAETISEGGNEAGFTRSDGSDGSDGGDSLLTKRVTGEMDDDRDLDMIGDVEVRVSTKALKPRNYQLGLCFVSSPTVLQIYNCLALLISYSKLYVNHKSRDVGREFEEEYYCGCESISGFISS